ncbi:CHAP domain-containing protein (plasmid) [Staphylococcus cohnii]|nr:CHAP domain-containing protein [Staphylococcus cohnii]
MDKKRWGSVFRFTILKILFVFLFSTLILQDYSPNDTAKAESNVIYDAQRGCSTSSDGGDSDENSESGESDSKDSKDKGSDKYDEIPNKENIKKIYDVLHGKHGFSAEFIAGILSNWWTEAQLDPTANEPGQFGKDTAKKATDGELGIGFGQWSFERHKALVDWAKKKDGNWWEIEHQMDYMVNGDDMFVDILKDLALDAKDDPVQEAVNFHNDWERSADSESKIRDERGGNAKKILSYMKDNGMDGKKDESKIKKIGKDSKGSSGASASDTDKEKETKTDPCADGEKGEGSSGSGDGSKIGDSTKVNGKKAKIIGKNYEWDELPSKYKKHVKLPKFDKSYLDKPGNLFPSTGNKGQCTELTWAYMNQLWKGKQPTNDDNLKNGDGKDIYKAYKDKDAKMTEKPTVGYGFSSDPPYAQATDPSVGHTGVVVGVMDDGKWIMANYNVPPKPAPSRTLYYSVVDGTDGNVHFFSGVGNKPKK